MTGCPYSLIYSASQTFDRLRREHRIRYHEGLLAVEVGQSEDVPYVIAKDVETGAYERFEADRNLHWLWGRWNHTARSEFTECLQSGH